jgi:hypothetical protein
MARLLVDEHREQSLAPSLKAVSQVATHLQKPPSPTMADISVSLRWRALIERESACAATSAIQNVRARAVIPRCTFRP